MKTASLHGGIVQAGRFRRPGAGRQLKNRAKDRRGNTTMQTVIDVFAIFVATLLVVTLAVSALMPIILMWVLFLNS